jgi:hypothetical protein
MEYAVIIDRAPDAPTVGAYSADPNLDVCVIRDASISDDDLISDFQDVLRAHLDMLVADGLPVPQPLYKVVTVAA